MASDAQPCGTASLEIDTDPSFQKRWWQVERAAWLLMGALLIAALCGLTGAGGPLSRGQVRAGGAVIDYPRIARWQSAEEATIRFAPGATGRVDVLLSARFAEAFDVEGVQPQPATTASTAEGLRFTFELGGGSGVRTASLSLRPSQPALPDRDTVRVGEAPPATVHFVILP
ncbi:hypothetical protein [Croceibacterium ferulae]|uniref:hypothetical protein n=1 Tax=Croceibacterium ferulae TaxID=1854641 RepID=UPI00138FF754|nr:hypothetical protein [Croceibacterium ferulae]